MASGQTQPTYLPFAKPAVTSTASRNESIERRDRIGSGKGAAFEAGEAGHVFATDAEAGGIFVAASRSEECLSFHYRFEGKDAPVGA